MAYADRQFSALGLGEGEQYLGEFVRSIACNHVIRVDLEVPPTLRRFSVLSRFPKRFAAWSVTTLCRGLDVAQTEVAILDWY